MDLSEFFEGREESRQLFEVLFKEMEALGGVKIRVTKSQVAFYRQKTFAWTWIPSRYLRGKVAQLVLTISLRHHDPSPRWKEIVEPTPGRFTHHLELYSTDDIDDEVRAWMKEALAEAG